MNVSERSSETYDVHLVEGKEAVLSSLPALELAAREWDQQALVQELPFYLSVPGKFPVLLLFKADPSPSSRIQGAIFLYAYAHTIFGRRLLSNADRFGRIGVFGPAAQHARIAVQATSFLLRNGSAAVWLSFTPGAEPLARRTAQEYMQALGLKPKRTGEHWTLRSHELFFGLPLYTDLDRTLSQLGRRTRRNVREVMRSCVAELGCSFVEDVDLTLEQFLQMNRRSARPVSARVARWRYMQFRHFPGILCGIQASDGQWLCLAGSRVSAATLIVDWQMNDLTFARYSPSLLMRGFLMQHFGLAGIRSLFFEGGTSHRMASNFNRNTVLFLQARRKTIWLKLLQALMERWLPTRSMTKALFGYG